jgi:2-aminoadipate transaminase
VAEWVTSARGQLREMVKLLARPDLLSFASGAPSVECLPRAVLAAIAARNIEADPLSLQLRAPSQALAQEVVSVMASRGVTSQPGQVLMVHGGQQGLDLAIRLLLEPGRPVLVEEATYPGLLSALEPYQPEVLRVPSDPAVGMDVDAVERLLEGGARPAFLYAMPEGHNPMGSRLPQGRRLHLVELARRYCVPIVEDDVAGLLQYDDTRLPPLRALDDRWVFYIGSFSKLIGPALRTGWMVVPDWALRPLSLIKDLATTDIRTVAQELITDFLAEGHLAQHLATIRAVYRERRDRTIAALREELPDEARFHEPQSGLFVWVRLPARFDTLALLRAAVDVERIAFIPGPFFGGDGQLSSCLRICFASCPSQAIEDGIARLGQLLRRHS